ncbi:DUF6631 family protein [Halothiobacillus sp.]|uniref:DUF6631 family protein n=1 Tax=Halothiobacillus sp. TaxID=1891311 RepID=UPI0026079ED8|nr:DUF6631 family protein [Halothiobacillus sp.]
MSEVDILFPEGKTITIGGEEITIKPLTFGQIPKASKMIAPIIKAMSSAELGGQSLLDLAGNWVEIMAVGGEDLIALIGWAINKDRDWFDSLGMDDGINLIKTVIEVNSDFFTKKVIPMLPQASQDSGATSSQSSSEPVTADAT